MNRITFVAIIAVIISGIIGVTVWSYMGNRVEESPTADSNFGSRDNISIGGLLINLTDIKLSGDGNSASRHLKIYATISNMNNESVQLSSNNFDIVQYTNQWYRQTTFTEPMELECTPQEEDKYYAAARQALLDEQPSDDFRSSLVYIKCGVVYDAKSGSAYFVGNDMRLESTEESSFSVDNSRVLVKQIPANSVVRVSLNSPDIVRTQSILVITKGSESVSLPLGSFG